MLSLDRPGPVHSRHHGQHVRRSDDQAGPDTFAVVPRHDTTGAGRYLSRLARTVLAGRLRSAAIALAEAADPALTRKQRAQGAELTFTVSVPCLLAQCRAGRDGPGCQSSACEHECHQRDRAPGGAHATAGASAAGLVPAGRPELRRRHRAGTRAGRLPA
jgi:hypothetical protein